ncbi:hypothetical protein [Kitasatospora cathayae]|uniref:Uncharacterized protein n=1 Tax=Kitasatospora cathayae TaxID=3004092 RepID=A0ABY7QI11_9ACTN|nr:hypothetical protein [Kitasatospora sp. HUAS 3-15]WBP92212.1 hypothetical protein O1G21_41120 [Kitasatospora sp. HUAS 3-15]
MTLLLDDMAARRDAAAAGPDGWHEAWERSVALLSPTWRRGMPDGASWYWDNIVRVDGCAALAMAYYLIARGAGRPVDSVAITEVIALIHGPGLTWRDIPGRWEDAMRSLGHDPEDAADPVSACWQELRIDNTPPPDAPDHVHMDTTRRWGPQFLEGLNLVLRRDLGIAFV